MSASTSFSALGGAIWRPLRWLLLAIFAAVLLELVTIAALERLNLSPPSALRRSECNDCVVFLGRVDRLLADTVTKYAADHVATLTVNEVRELAKVPSNPFDLATRKTLNKHALNTACRGHDSVKHCVHVLQKQKAKILALMISSDAAIRLAIQRAAIDSLSAVGDGAAAHAYVSPELYAEVDAARIRGLCTGQCQPSSLLDLVLPPMLIADPAVEPLIALFGELWGMVFVVTVVGSLLVAILHIRASAARRHHQLYLRLASQFRNRVTPASQHTQQQPPQQAPATRNPPTAPAATNSKSIGKVT